MELLERAGHLAQLESLLDDARSGSGRLALITAEAGGGKTSLVRSFVAGLPSDVASLWGSCDPLTVPRPAGPFRDMTAIRERIHRGSGRLELLESILGLLQDAVTVMVLEDVHWADDATADALRFLGRRVDRTKSLVLVTLRVSDADRGANIQSAIGDITTAAGFRRIDLPALSPDAVDLLASEHGVDGRRLHDLTRGNPFYVTEVLAAPGWSVPPSVADAVLARVSRLDEAARRVLEAISIAPRGLAPELATLVGEAGAGAVDACIESGIIVLEWGRLGFRHELARRAVEDSIAPTRRRRLHARLLDELDGTPGADPATLAHHAAAAADRRLLRIGPAAAREAAARGAHREAADHLGLTIENVNGLSDPELASLLSEWAIERARFEDPSPLVEMLERACRLHQASGDVVGEGRDLVRLAQVTRRRGDALAAGRLLAEAVERLETIAPGPDLALAYARLATHHVGEYRFDEALRFADRAIELGQRIGAPDAVVVALDARAEAETCGTKPIEGVASSEEVYRLAQQVGDDEGAIAALINAGGNLIVIREYEAARRHIDRAIQDGVAGDFDFMVRFARTCLARLEFEQGRWRAAEALADELLTGTAEGGVIRATALTVRGRVLVRRGELVLGGAALEDAISSTDSIDLAFKWPIVAGLAEASWLAGERLPIADLDRLYERVVQAPVPWAAGELAMWRQRAGVPPAATDTLAEPYALQIRGRWGEAAEAWKAIGAPYERAEALADGDEPAMREALAIFSRLGAEPAADRLREQMRRRGVRHVPARPRASTRLAPAQLTRRQLEILGLLERGLSNAEIGSRLFITEKTAEHHVSAILAKLGAASRAEAGSAARRLGIVEPQT